jgi:hypothetical protein
MDTALRIMAQKTKTMKTILIIIKKTRIPSLSVLMTIAPIIAAYANGLRTHPEKSNSHKDVIPFSKTVVNPAYLINPYMIS